MKNKNEDREMKPLNYRKSTIFYHQRPDIIDSHYAHDNSGLRDAHEQSPNPKKDIPKRHRIFTSMELFFHI
jgi:hypothetical protein